MTRCQHVGQRRLFHYGIKLWSTTVTLFIWSCVCEQALAELKEYCFPNAFNASCAAGTVIVMEEARYGRLRRGGCLKTDYQIGCWADVLPVMDLRCSGRRKCIVPIPDTALHDIQPCTKDLFAYLEASYRCQQVEMPKSASICREVERSSVAVSSAGGRGFLSSLIAQEKGAGGVTCPWLILLQPGQRINLTLLDFGVASRYERGATDCQIYAVIRDLTSRAEMTICGGFRRERSVYVSEGRGIEILLHTYGEDTIPIHYIITYEALGCGDPSIPAATWFTRRGDQATVGCNFTSQTWHIVCSGRRWVGVIENCTYDNEALAGSYAQDGSDNYPFPFGLVIAIMVGVGVGLVCGTLLLAFIYLWYRRYRKLRKRDEATATKTTGIKTLSPPFCQMEILPSDSQLPFLQQTSTDSSAGCYKCNNELDGSACYWITDNSAICRDMSCTRAPIFDHASRSYCRKSSYIDNTLPSCLQTDRDAATESNQMVGQYCLNNDDVQPDMMEYRTLPTTLI